MKLVLLAVTAILAAPAVRAENVILPEQQATQMQRLLQGMRQARFSKRAPVAAAAAAPSPYARAIACYRAIGLRVPELSGPVKDVEAAAYARYRAIQSIDPGTYHAKCEALAPPPIGAMD